MNFSRSFIYTTALPEHALRAIALGYKTLSESSKEVVALYKNILYFNEVVVQTGLKLRFRESDTAIQTCIISDNQKVTAAAGKLQAAGYNVSAIRSPTVPQGEERLRICLHSFNTQDQIGNMLTLLAKILKN